MPQNELPAQRREEVRLAPSRQSEGKDVDGAVGKTAFDERWQLPPDFRGQLGLVAGNPDSASSRAVRFWARSTASLSQRCRITCRWLQPSLSARCITSSY